MDDDEYRYRGPMRLNGRIMITAIVCLFVVIVIVVLLHIYARCVLRRQARRRAALRQLGIPVGITTMAQMNEPKRGLSESVIASLPSFVYKNVDHMNNSTTTTGGNPIECSVCLCTLEDGETARLLPNCKHTFHAECIDMWLNSHSTCPICRTEAEPSDQLQQHQPGAESVIELGQLSGAGGAAVATAPVIEGTSSNSAKVGRTESSSRLSSFRRMLSRERIETTTTTRIQQTDNGVGDIERQ